MADLYLTNGNRVKVKEGSAILYIDQDHLSLAGASLAKERIGNAMTGILQKSYPH